MRTRVLLADEDPQVLAALQRCLREGNGDLVCATDGEQAIARIEHDDVDLCVTDLQLPKRNGFAVLEAARRRRPPVAVIVLTGNGTVRDAISALRLGACDFLAKPFHLTALEESLLRVLDERSGTNRTHRAQRAALIGDHPAMRLVLERIDQVADTDANVLIRGETGTGKEVVARLIHTSSSRRAAPFVAMNMAAIPENLAESELFGHLRGAFTGAERTRTGKFRAADHGSLFLDEIGDMPKGLQAKLLRALQERAVQPVGGGESVAIDVRVIAATHRNLEQLVKEGSFREDLYYRLDVIPIELPPLRERREDIGLLAEHFRKEFNARDGRLVPGFTPEVLARMQTYDWPGNVRQLENAIERLVLLAGNRIITIDDLPPNLRGDVVDVSAGRLDLPPSGVDLRMLLLQLEDRFIKQALARTGGNKNRAAELLGMNRTTLVEKLRRRNVA
jgi:two-component system, NtrC family, response regulator AtoC